MALTVFLQPLQHRTLSLEGRDLIKTSHLRLSVPGGWKDGSAIKSTHWLFFQFNSQQPSVMGSDALFLCVWRQLRCTHIHKIKFMCMSPCLSPVCECPQRSEFISPEAGVTSVYKLPAVVMGIELRSSGWTTNTFSPCLKTRPLVGFACSKGWSSPSEPWAALTGLSGLYIKGMKLGGAVC